MTETLIQFTHYGISFLYVIAVIVVLVRTFRGWTHKLEWSNRLQNLAILVVLTMYLQLILGVYLFVVRNYLVSGSSLKAPSEVRFWAVEHFYVMLFALIISQLGYINSTYHRKVSDKHRIIFLYFSLSLSMVFLSLTMILLGS